MPSTLQPFPGFQNWNPQVPGFPYANLLEQLAASMGTINPGTYGRFGAATTTAPTVTPKADVGGLLGGGTGGGSTGNTLPPPTPAGTNDPGFGAGFGSGGLLGGLPSNVGGAAQTSYGVAPSGLTLGSNAVGVDPATGRQILRAPDGSTRLGARPLPSFTPQQFSTALASNPQAAYWMLARGGTPAQNTMMQASGLDQTGINQFINRYAPGIGQVYGPSGWIPTR